MIKQFFLIGVLTSCSSASDPWRQDAVTAGSSRFDTRRLSYEPLSGYPPWKMEVVQMDGETDIFISLTKHRFHPASHSREIKVVLRTNEQTIEELTPLFEGNMKLRLTHPLSQALIQSLQEGQKVSILINEWEETLDCSSFEKNFAQFMNPGFNWLNIQTPLK